MTDFFERLDKYIDFKGLNDNKLTKISGLSNGLIGKARKRGFLSLDNVSKLLFSCEDLNAHWLLTGHGEMINNTEFKNIKPKTLPERNVLDVFSFPSLPVENKRIKKIIEYYCNGNELQFSKEISISQPRINRLFSIDPRSNKYPLVSFEITQAIVTKFTKVSADWIMTGEGHMIKNHEEAKKADTSFFGRLTQVCQVNHIKNIGELARKLGYSSPEKLYRLERDKSNKPSYQIILDLSVLFDNIDLNWLITGKGSILKTDVFKQKSDHLFDNHAIPLYNIEASAGIVALFNDSYKNEPVDHIQIPNLPKCDGAIYITGDSMYPLLKSGDIIMYNRVHNIRESIFFGEMYLICLNAKGDEMVTVKYIQKSDRGDDFVKLVSQNTNYDDKDVPITNIGALALIKASIRINSMS